MKEKGIMFTGILLFLLSLLHSSMQDFFNSPQWMILIVKMFASSIFLILGLKNYFQNINRKNFNLLIVLLLFWLADLILPFYFVVGGALFAIGHILLISQNLNFHFNRKELYIFIFCFIFMIGICMILPVSTSMTLRILGGIYLSILFVFLYSARHTSHIMRIGIILFVSSDIILGINKIIGPNFIRHFLNLALYYEAVLCFISTMKKRKLDY